MRVNLKEITTEVVSENKNKKKNKDITIHIIHILDGSGSMHGLKFESAKLGMHEELTSIKNEKDGIKYTYTVVEFDNYDRILTLVNKEDASKLNIEDIKLFDPCGNTALYDAIGTTLSSFTCNHNDKVIVKIFTDGGENSSRSFIINSIKELIEEKENKGWVITFVGTEYDVKNMINNIKLKKGNTLSYDGTASGLRSAYTKSNESRITYAKAVIKGEEESVSKNFFNK